MVPLRHPQLLVADEEGAGSPAPSDEVTVTDSLEVSRED